MGASGGERFAVPPRLPITRHPDLGVYLDPPAGGPQGVLADQCAQRASRSALRAPATAVSASPTVGEGTAGNTTVSSGTPWAASRRSAPSTATWSPRADSGSSGTVRAGVGAASSRVSIAWAV